MNLSPNLHYYSVMWNCPTNLEDNIDFWYDSLGDCYRNDMSFDMIATYVDAITEEDSE